MNVILTLYIGSTLESLAWQRQNAPPRSSIKNEAPPLPAGKDFHVFFSCHDDIPDSNWMKAVMRELEQRGYKCCSFPKDYDIGKSLSDNLRHVLHKSMRVVSVLTSAYIREEWVQMEMEIISYGLLDKLVFIPVLVEPCDIPPFLKYFRYVSALYSRETWWETFMQSVKGDVPNMTSKKKYHVFLAHAPSDTKMVTDIVNHLETPQQSLACFYPARDFKQGFSMRENIELALKRSLTIVLIVSKSFLANEWKKYYEGRLRNKHIVPVIVSECNLPIALDDVICIDARSLSGNWMAVLSQAIKQQGKRCEIAHVSSLVCTTVK